MDCVHQFDERMNERPWRWKSQDLSLFWLSHQTLSFNITFHEISSFLTSTSTPSSALYIYNQKLHWSFLFSLLNKYECHWILLIPSTFLPPPTCPTSRKHLLDLYQANTFKLLLPIDFSRHGVILYSPLRRVLTSWCHHRPLNPSHWPSRKAQLQLQRQQRRPWLHYKGRRAPSTRPSIVRPDILSLTTTLVVSEASEYGSKLTKYRGHFFRVWYHIAIIMGTFPKGQNVSYTR